MINLKLTKEAKQSFKRHPDYLFKNVDSRLDYYREQADYRNDHYASVALDYLDYWYSDLQLTNNSNNYLRF